MGLIYRKTGQKSIGIPKGAYNIRGWADWGNGDNGVNRYGLFVGLGLMLLLIMAGEEGFEPSLTGPEPAVLPLDYSPAQHNYSNRARL